MRLGREESCSRDGGSAALLRRRVEDRRVEEMKELASSRIETALLFV